MELMACVLILLAVIERLWRWASKVKRSRTSIASTGFEEFQTVFESSKRIQLEQRLTDSLLREDEGDAAPPNGVRIDLDSGKVVIKPPVPRDSPQDKDR